MALAGMCYFFYSMVGFLALSSVHPVTCEWLLLSLLLLLLPFLRLLISVSPRLHCLPGPSCSSTTWSRTLGNAEKGRD